MCGPILRPGSVKTAATPTPRSKLARAGARSSEEVINKVWECVRENNGIMTLLQVQIYYIES